MDIPFDRDRLLEVTSDALARIRADRPRVHGLTNTVAQAFTANILLSLGAVPTMTGAADEVADFVARSGALYVNLGTLDAGRRAGIAAGIAAARENAVPWVLDPAHCEASPGRTRYAIDLLAHRPALLRVNAREAAALFPDETVEDAARRSAVAIALTGAQDRVTDGASMIDLANGVALQDRVTAVGCAGTAIVAACCAVGLVPLHAAAAGLTLMNVAAERAAETAGGPGTFAALLLDALHALDTREIGERARLSERAHDMGGKETSERA